MIHMKNPERVAELLAELRELAENDFECHRIDVLERDLTEPPTVEVIDDTHQKFGGFTFSTDAKNHFRLPVEQHLQWVVALEQFQIVTPRQLSRHFWIFGNRTYP